MANEYNGKICEYGLAAAFGAFLALAAPIFNAGLKVSPKSGFITRQLDATELNSGYQTFLDERKAKLELSKEQSLFLDKAVITLGGGGLGLTLTFLQGLDTIKSAPYVIAGLAGFAVSLTCMFLSLHASQRSISVHINVLDDHWSRNSVWTEQVIQTLKDNAWIKFTGALNLFAAIALAVGITCVAMFVFNNVPTTSSKGSSQVMSKKVESTTRPAASQSQKGLVIKPPPPPPPKSTRSNSQ
jgi:hypothetical protein